MHPHTLITISSRTMNHQKKKGGALFGWSPQSSSAKQATATTTTGCCGGIHGCSSLEAINVVPPTNQNSTSKLELQVFIILDHGLWFSFEYFLSNLLGLGPHLPPFRVVLSVDPAIRFWLDIIWSSSNGQIPSKIQ